MTKKIVCAVDDTEHSKVAIDVAAQMARAMDAELELLAVDQLLGGIGGKGGAAAYLWNEGEVQRILEDAVAEARKAGYPNPKTAMAQSRDVARAIVIFAEENGADHIVVGTGGKGPVSRFTLGSVSQDVVHRAHCPVTIAR